MHSPSNGTDTYLTVNEVAEILQCHRNTVKKIPAAYLPYWKLNVRGDRRYARSDVDEYIEGSYRRY